MRHSISIVLHMKSLRDHQKIVVNSGIGDARQNAKGLDVGSGTVSRKVSYLASEFAPSSASEAARIYQPTSPSILTIV